MGPCVVTQIKTLEKDGYEAVQLGFEEKKEKHTTQPEMGHFKKAGVTPKRYLAEFKNFETEYKLGDVITVDYLEDAGFVDVVGTSKGKGFQGVVKRHGFGGVGRLLMVSITVCVLPVVSVPVLTLQRYSKVCVWPAKWVMNV